MYILLVLSSDAVADRVITKRDSTATPASLSAEADAIAACPSCFASAARRRSEYHSIAHLFEAGVAAPPHPVPGGVYDGKQVRTQPLFPCPTPSMKVQSTQLPPIICSSHLQHLLCQPEPVPCERQNNLPTAVGTVRSAPAGRCRHRPLKVERASARA